MNDASACSRICLVTPPTFEPAAFASLLDRALGCADVAAVRLRMPSADPGTLARAAGALRAVTNRADVALLLDGDPATALRLGCDGAHVPAAGAAAARGTLGTSGSVGAACGWSRDTAMRAAEAGADYVAFGPASQAGPEGRDIVADWTLAMVVPCVVGGDLDEESAAEWATTGAEFLALGRAVWQAPQGPEAMLRALARRLKP
jgi:thiamine-phosphate pyrophosphorylase